MRGIRFVISILLGIAVSPALAQPDTMTEEVAERVIIDGIRYQRSAGNGRYQWPAKVQLDEAPDWCRQLAGDAHFGWFWLLPTQQSDGQKVYTRLAMLQLTSLDRNCSGLARYVVAPARESGAPFKEYYDWRGDQESRVTLLPDGNLTLLSSYGLRGDYQLHLDLKAGTAIYSSLRYSETYLARSFTRVTLQQLTQPEPTSSGPQHWLVGAWAGSFPDNKNPVRALEINNVAADGTVSGRWGLGVGRTGPVSVTLAGDTVDIVTQAASRVTLKRVDDNTLAGQFTLKNGASTPITLQRQ